MRLTIFLIVVTGLLWAGCSALDTDFRKEGVGREGRIVVVIDSTLWDGAVGEELRGTISGPISTLPSMEPHFVLEPRHLVSQHALESAQEQRNVMFVGVIGDTTSNESRWLNSAFSDEVRATIQSGTPVAFDRRDPWRRRQLAYYVVANTVDELIPAINEAASDIVYAYNLVTRERMYRELFDIGRQHDIEEQLMERHGFAVNAQHDYLVATDTTQFVWLRRILTDTWRSVFVYYQDRADPSTLTPENVIARRNALTQEYIRGTEDGFVEVVLSQPITVDSIDFKGRFGYEIRGMWEMVGVENGRKFQFGQGGGFLTYAFYDPPSGRLYMIDGMLFAPGYPKREFLRQLEVIAYTFRTAQDVARQAAD